VVRNKTTLNASGEEIEMERQLRWRNEIKREDKVTLN
jgi:hypothetical protein